MSIDTSRKAPTVESIAKMLTELLGVPTTTKILSAPIPTATFRIFSTYVDDSNKLTWVGGMDIAFGASTGAALAMLPIGAVTEAIKSGAITAAMVENSREVANVAANLFNTLSGHGHVRLQDYLVAPKPIPPTIAPLLAKPVHRVDLEVLVRGYPAGKIALFRAAPYGA